MQQFLQRSLPEEGIRKFAYNDATGAQVTCRPSGNLSIGVGINLEVGLDDAEIAWLLEHRAGLVEQQLGQFTWYGSLCDPAKSVLIDMGFNLGVHGLLGFPHMIAALAKEPPDYADASSQCAVAEPRLDLQRYAPLRAILSRCDG